jgi:hypothetical protein
MLLLRFMLVSLLFFINTTASLAMEENNKPEKLLLISKFPFKYTPFHEAFKEISPENMILLTSFKMPLEEANRFQKSYREIQRFHPNDFSSTKFELACIKLRERFQYTRIVIFDEADLIFAAHLRKLFSLEGQSVESALAFKDKYTMKSHVTLAGVEVANFSKISSLAELYEFLSRNNFPIVLKPLDGAGSVNTHIINSNLELEKVISDTDYFNHYHPSTFLCESYVPGDMYHVDGLIHNGIPIAIHPSKYINSCLDFVNGKPLGDYTLSNSNPLYKKLIDYTKKVLSSLPEPRDYAFHLELFHHPDGRFIFCEVASRVGGAEINLSWQETFGIDLKKEFFRLQAGLLPSFDISTISQSCTHMNLMFPPQKGKLVSLPPVPFNWLDVTDFTAKEGDSLSKPTKSTEHFAKFLFKAPSEDILLSRTDELILWMNSNVIWNLE